MLFLCTILRPDFSLALIHCFVSRKEPDKNAAISTFNRRYSDTVFMVTDRYFEHVCPN